MSDHEMCKKHDGEIREIQIQLTEIVGDVKHIKDRIDNGLSATVTKIWDKLNIMAIERTKLETIVASNCFFLDKLKSAIIRVSVFSVAGGAIAIAWKIIHTYIS